MRSRFVGAQAFLAPWIKAFFPHYTPDQVRALRVMDVPAILGWDEEPVVQAAPLDETDWRPKPPPAHVLAQMAEIREREGATRVRVVER